MTQHAVASLAQLDEHRPLRVQAGNEELILIRQGNQFMPTRATAPTQVPRLTKAWSAAACWSALGTRLHSPSMTGWSANPLRWLTCAATRLG